MQRNLLATCWENTCSVLAAIADVFVAVVLRDEQQRLNKYVRVYPRERNLVYTFVINKLLMTLALIFRS